MLIDQQAQQPSQGFVRGGSLVVLLEAGVKEEEAFEVGLCEVRGIVRRGLRVEVARIVWEEVDLSVIVEGFQLELVDGF